MSNSPLPSCVRDGHARGWNIIPVTAEKIPMVKWAQYQDQRIPLEQLEEWARSLAPAVWAVITGRLSRVIVLDPDGAVGAETARALHLDPHVRTGSGSGHVYLRHPGWRVPTLTGTNCEALRERYPGLDVRGDGGLAIFAGMSAKGPYTILRPLDAADLYDVSVLPADLRAILGEPGAERVSSRREIERAHAIATVHDRPRDMKRAIAGEGEKYTADELVEWAIARVGVAGGRNNAGISLAIQLRDLGLTYAEAEPYMERFAARLLSTNARGENAVYSIEEARASLRQAYTRAPREPMRHGATRDWEENIVDDRTVGEERPSDEHGDEEASPAIVPSSVADELMNTPDLTVRDVYAAVERLAELSEVEFLLLAGELAERLGRRLGVTDLKRIVKEKRKSAGGDLVRAVSRAIMARRVYARHPSGVLYALFGGVFRRVGVQIDDAQGNPWIPLVLAREVEFELDRIGATRHYSTHFVAEVEAHILSHAQPLRMVPPPDVINVRNGFIEITDGDEYVFTAHDDDAKRPKYAMTIQLPVEYDPSATCPAWEMFVEEIFPDAETCMIAWEIIAWMMTSDTSIQKSVFLLGEGSNGKSSFLNGVKAFLGRENTSSKSLVKLEDDRFALADLSAKLANICGDLPVKGLEKSEVFKLLTGGDAHIDAQHKFGQPFTFQNFAKLLFAGNSLPEAKDASHAFFRRWVIIPFLRVFAPRGDARTSTEISRALKKPRELSGVLNRALSVLIDLRRRGDFTKSAAVEDILTEFRELTDPLRAWFDANIESDVDGFIPCADLVKAYRKYAEEHGHQKYNSTTLGQAFRRMNRKVVRKQKRVGGIQINCYFGIRLKSPALVSPYGGTREDHPLARINPSADPEQERFAAAWRNTVGDREVTEDELVELLRSDRTAPLWMLHPSRDGLEREDIRLVTARWLTETASAHTDRGYRLVRRNESVNPPRWSVRPVEGRPS